MTRRMKRLINDDSDPDYGTSDVFNGKRVNRIDMFQIQILSNEVLSAITDTTDIVSPLSLSPTYSQDAGICNEDNDVVIDIDASTYDDPSYAVTYVGELYNQLKSYENQFKITDYFTSQVFISHKLRGKCVDFIIQMCFEINARDETLFATITLLDRYLSLTSFDIKAPQLILLALSCLMISYKFEEVYFNIHRTLKIAESLITLNLLGDNIRLSKEMMVKTEVVILETVEWKLICPNVFTFCVRYLHVSDEELRRNAYQNRSEYESQKRIIHDLTSCIIDRILVESSLLTYLPSQLAAAALYIARSKSAVYGVKDWTRTLEFYTGYSKKDLEPIVKAVLGTFALEVATHENMKKILLTSEAINSKMTNILNGCRNKHGDETYEIVMNSY